MLWVRPTGGLTGQNRSDGALGTYTSVQSVFRRSHHKTLIACHTLVPRWTINMRTNGFLFVLFCFQCWEWNPWVCAYWASNSATELQPSPGLLDFVYSGLSLQGKSWLTWLSVNQDLTTLSTHGYPISQDNIRLSHTCSSISMEIHCEYKQVKGRSDPHPHRTWPAATSHIQTQITMLGQGKLDRPSACPPAIQTYPGQVTSGAW